MIGNSLENLSEQSHSIGLARWWTWWSCDCINNGEIGVEELADALSEIFGVEIKNCYNVYMNMKRRKDDSRTYFLDELREKLNKRMRESDLKSGKFKKR